MENFGLLERKLKLVSIKVVSNTFYYMFPPIMHVAITFLLSVLFFLSVVTPTFAYQEILIEERGGKAMRVIKVILDGEHFVVASPAKLGGETLEQLTKNVGGISAINGAFFCPQDYTNCNKQTFSNYERVFKGDGQTFSTYRPDTSIRGIFGFQKDGTPLFVQNKISIADVGLMSNINADKINDLYFGISNFPVLLIEGEDVTAGAAEYIDSKLTGKGNRNFICSTADAKTVYLGVVGASSVREMAPYLKKNLGCYNALFLDAGASLGMVYSGNVLDKATRTLITDAFVVVDRATYVSLGGEVPSGVTPYVPEYVLNADDKKQIEKLTTLIDLIYQHYDKATYQTLLISMFRKLINAGNLTPAQKAVYNQVLIYLFTIEKL
ncbi:MAG: phosphodiester glycosidase family protein [Candidatus Peribacteria bacterium]|jgi:exopolysaccharide biosynthesis protein|nr:phosphodiester glycosidase family protein [Candidatus Peribacteria bacterium]